MQVARTPIVPRPDVRTIARAVARDGYCIVAGCMAPGELGRMAHQSARLWERGVFVPAAVGRGEGRQRRTEIRTDHVLWLDRIATTGTQRRWLDRLERLQHALNRATFAGLHEWEGHLAVYPTGSFYRRHLDVHRGDPARQFSTILYLNEDWRPGDGGELRLWLDADGCGAFVDVPPVGGTLVVFDSHRFWHEVRPSNFERHSITGWFRTRPSGPV